MNYYNENEPYAAQWLRNLIEAGLIPPGHVDDRSIKDIMPGDLDGFTQCHFFAGLGGWSRALELAGWHPDTPVWTGSCPCQPFSASGARGGFADERHLWPHFHHLIRECRPPIVIGEQVASKDGLAWFDLVQADLEGTGYAVGATDMCAAGIEAPHIRQRLWWMAHSHDAQRRTDSAERNVGYRPDAGRPQGPSHAERCGYISQLAHADSTGLQRRRGMPGHSDQCAAGVHGLVGGLADTISDDSRRQAKPSSNERSPQTDRPSNRLGGYSGVSLRSNQVNSFWADSDWIRCRDDKWRPVEPGTFPLAHGVPKRVDKLRALGNAIVPQVAAQFIQAVM